MKDFQDKDLQDNLLQVLSSDRIVGKLSVQRFKNVEILDIEKILKTQGTENSRI